MDEKKFQSQTSYLSLNHPGEIFQEFSSKDTYRLKVKGRKMIFQANGNEKEGRH